MTCKCGSNNYPFWIHDAHGIPLVKACESCEEEKLKKYRPEVLNDSNYECCEEIDEDQIIMNTKHPDRWVLLEFTSKEHNGTFRKILSSWYGRYLDGDSWNLSSPIVNFNQKDNCYEIETESSLYVCHKNSYGMSSYTGSIYETMLESAKSKNVTLTLLEENNLLK